MMTVSLISLLILGSDAAAEPTAPRLIRRADPTHVERYRFEGTVPAGFHVMAEPRFAALGAGVAVFGVAYLVGVIVGSAEGKYVSAIPFAGPLLASGPRLSLFSSSLFGLLDSAAQLAGAILFIVGCTESRWLERDPSPPAISFAPAAPGADVGVSVRGHF